jgi:hypothetical protein
MYSELMKNLDYRQLHTFWTVAKEGSVTRASTNSLLIFCPWRYVHVGPEIVMRRGV